MADREFYVVDVFAESPRAGNQLAVVIARGDESQDEMQSIAREFNFSETTFLFPRRSGEETLWMRQNPPEFSNEELDRPTVAAAVGLEPSDIDPEFPIQIVSTEGLRDGATIDTLPRRFGG